MDSNLHSLIENQNGWSFARYLMESTWRLNDAIRKRQHFDCIVHCHVPKTAGVAFYQPFKTHFPSFHVDHTDIRGSIEAFFARGAKQDCRFYTGHFSTADIVDHIPAGRVLVAGVIREPVDRLISHYNYNSSPAHTWHEDFRRRFPDFASFWRSGQFGDSPMSRQLFSGLRLRDGVMLSPGGREVEFAFAPQHRMNPFIHQLFAAMGEGRAQVHAERKNVTGEEAKRIHRSDLSREEVAAISQEHAFDVAFYDIISRSENLLNSFRRARIAEAVA